MQIYANQSIKSLVNYWNVCVVSVNFYCHCFVIAFFFVNKLIHIIYLLDFLQLFR